MIGAGWWGEQHARVMSARDDTTLCAVIARTEQSATARAATYGARTYTSIDEMLEAERPDLVTLSLPNLDHFEPTMNVLRSGTAVLAEKPLVFDLDEADTLLAEADRQGTFFAVNFNHRYARAVQNAKRDIDAGRHRRHGVRLVAVRR